MLRPGNAGTNDADHHVVLLDRSLSSLPEEYQFGHFAGDHEELVTHPILVRADAAGATHGFVEGSHRGCQLRLLHRISNRRKGP
jgi:hypothetical protein